MLKSGEACLSKLTGTQNVSELLPTSFLQKQEVTSGQCKSAPTPKGVDFVRAQKISLKLGKLGLSGARPFAFVLFQTSRFLLLPSPSPLETDSSFLGGDKTVVSWEKPPWI